MGDGGRSTAVGPGALTMSLTMSFDRIVVQYVMVHVYM